MNKKIKLVLIVLLIGVFIVACKKEEIQEEIVEEEVLEEVEEEIEEEVVEENPVKEGIPSPLSGLYGPEEKVNRRPIAIMFDNHPRARWQSGLKDAEIIYEFQVEAPYTRYMGLFLMNDPEQVGPIRSSRPYFVTKVLEYDAVYVRVGGSNQAMLDIKNLKVADIDGLTSSNKVFWRLSHKKIPHNLYSSMEVLRKTQEDRKYKMQGDYTGFLFKEDPEDIQGQDANKILIQYRKDNKTEYIYDQEAKVYTRYKDGDLHIDESDESPLMAKNIIIQPVITRVIDNEGRLAIDLEGQGQGLYISHGKSVEIKWSKESRSSRTIYMDLEDNELVLNPGVTWIQMVNLNTEIIIDEGKDL